MSAVDLFFLLTFLGSGVGLLLLSRLLASRSTGPLLPRIYWRVFLPPDAALSAVQAASFFAALSPLLSPGQPCPSVEWRALGGEVTLLLGAPEAWEEALRGQLGVWLPGARLEREEDEMPHAPLATGVLPLRLRMPDFFPLRLPEGNAPDPLLPLIGTLTSSPRAGGLRLTWGPAPADWLAWAHAALEALEQGRPIPPRQKSLQYLTLLVQGLSPERPSSSGVRPAASDSLSGLTGAREKLQEPLFATRLDVWAAGETPEAARERAGLLAAHLQSFHAPEGNSLVPDGSHSLAGAGSRNPGGRGPELILSASELGALFHLPADLPKGVSQETVRQVPPPLALRKVPSGQEESARLGEALTPEGPVPFGLALPERRLHLYVVGKTGTGKSTLLANLLRQDLLAGHGVGLIDPHGDLAERVLALVPPERAEDVLYLNPADRDYPVPFNLFSCPRPEARPLVASGVVGVFKKLYGDSWGPRLEHFLRNAVLALLESPAPSLLLLPRLLSDRAYRGRLLQHVHDPLLRSFFHTEFEGYDPRWRAEAISPILNKVGQFLSSPLVRNVVGSRHPGFSLREVMDRGGIFLGNLATGKIGEDNAALLGGLLVAGFQLAAMSRADQPEGERRDFFLYVDEFQHFAGEAFAGILSEARKFRLSLTLSHQYLDQLPPGISDAVFGNTGSLCVFRVGQADTARVVRELAPQFGAEDLVQLPNHHFCARISQGGQTLPAFSARTLPPPTGYAQIQPLIEGSRRRWARPRAEVELEIADLWEGRMD